MTYKKTLIYTLLATILLVCTILLGIFCIPRLVFYMPGVQEATVSYADSQGVYGKDDLFILDENGNKKYFQWKHPEEISSFQSNQKVLVLGEIVFMDSESGDRTNQDLRIVGKSKLYMMSAFFLIVAFFFLVITILACNAWIKKPWKQEEETAVKNNIQAIFWMVTVIATLASFVGVFYGAGNLIKYLYYDYHGIGTIVYVTDAPDQSNIDSTFTRYDENVQVILDEAVYNDERFSITYFHTKGHWFSKNRRAIVVYNDFYGNDGDIFTYTEIIFQIISVIILLIETVIIIIKINGRKRTSL